VPAYNEEDSLGSCLDTLAQQTIGHELVVVDDGSTDATAATACSRGVRVVESPHRGPAVARNIGAANTTAPILAFLDADMTFAPDFLERLIEPILRNGAVGSFTRDEFVSNVDNRWARYTNTSAGLPPNRRMPADHADESRVFRAIRRDAFESVGGYDDVGVGEDVTLARKLGTLAVRADGAVCWHRNPDRLREVFLSARWYAKGDLHLPTLANWLRCIPPIAAIRAVRKGWQAGSASYAVFRFVHDAGTFVGFLERTVLNGHHAR
jgi:glycosyltransferase involved in cell wall biosynthesis